MGAVTEADPVGAVGLVPGTRTGVGTAAGAALAVTEAAGTAVTVAPGCAAVGWRASGHSESPAPEVQLRQMGKRAPIRAVRVEHIRPA
jgi:hypothetical protein